MIGFGAMINAQQLVDFVKFFGRNSVILGFVRPVFSISKTHSWAVVAISPMGTPILGTEAFCHSYVGFRRLENVKETNCV